MIKKFKLLAMIAAVVLCTAALPMSAFASNTDPDTPLVDGGVYMIKNVHSGKVIEVGNSYKFDGAGVQQWSWWGGNNQRWRAVLVDSKYYKFINMNSGKVLESPGGVFTWGIQLQQWSWNGGNNQKWALYEVLDLKMYNIFNKDTGLLMDVNQSSTDNGAWIIQWGYTGNGKSNEQFTFTRVA